MAEPPTKRRSARQRAGRKRSIYYDPDTDEELDVLQEDAEDEEIAELAQPQPQRPRKRKRKAVRLSKPETRSRTRKIKKTESSSGPSRGRSGQKQAKKRHHAFSKVLATPVKKTRTNLNFTGPSDGRIPDWNCLPADTLRTVFIFASRPMHEQTTTASANATWLLRAARTCRVFSVPALEAFYQSPALRTSLHLHHFLELLLMPVEKTFIDYKVKVRALQIDVRQLAYTALNKPPFNLTDLVRRLPRLQNLEIIHPVDSPPYRTLKVQRWTYPLRDLFATMDEVGQHLKSWRWTREMFPHQNAEDVFVLMTSIHTRKSFEYLERLVLCDYLVNDSAEAPPSEDPARHRTPGLASAISVLPNVKDCSFISCDIIMEDFLERLPKDLERLELSNCLEVTSAMLSNYLKTGGSRLRELVLNSNPALNLAFLPALKALAPRLEVLKMDFTYYSERVTYNDAWALYDELLTVDDIPTWPSTLQQLELVHLQKLEAEAAQNLFRSLVDNAAELLNLRHLSLHAHINIPWRDRAGFRDQWIERLQRVYLRKDHEPQMQFGSLKEFRLLQQEQSLPGSSSKALGKMRRIREDADYEEPAPRRASLVRVTPRRPQEGLDSYPDSESKHGHRRRSARVAESQTAAAPSPSIPDENTPSESEIDEDHGWRTQPEVFTQGMCEVVDIRIDNQRPRENQYTEANFLDSEPSGDEDWHSGAELSDDDRYAW